MISGYEALDPSELGYQADEHHRGARHRMATWAASEAGEKFCLHRP